MVALAAEQSDKLVTTTSKNNATAAIVNGAGAASLLSTNVEILPKGKYTLVGIDIDTTGRRLIDEVCYCCL